MFDRLFRPAPLLDAESVVFMQTIQQWAWSCFGREHFDHQIQLVLPTNQFFPERISSVEEMAQQLLRRMQGYIGLQHWPLTVSPAAPQPLQLPANLATPAIDRDAPPPAVPEEAPAIVLHYNRLQASDPQAMIATHGQQLGACLLAIAPTPPPASADQLPLVAELLVTQMGFGIQLANSAFKFAGGCCGGGCSPSGRTAYLNQDEALMALALFCQAKQIEAAEVTPHLNKHLRPLFKRGLRQLQQPS